MRIAYTRRALRELKNIHQYLVTNSPQGAETVRSAIDKALDTLEMFPRSGRYRPRFRDRAFYVNGTNYFIIYWLDVRLNEVLVLTILDARSGTPR
jgi:plasmid stabilization system protein ParE